MARFSIILPTYRRNQSGRLRKAIESVLAQTFSDFELFLVDDGSTDGSAETIQSFVAQDSRVKHIRFEQNVGLPALTCVRAFLQASGELLAWMFDDCEWTPGYLDEMSGVVDAHPEADVVYAQCQAHFSGGVQIVGVPLDRDAILAGNNHIPNVSTVIRRSVFYKVGWYDPRIALVRNNDWDFLRRAVLAGISFHHHPKPLTHEYGVALPDSLGNYYFTDYALVDAITSADRLEELHPDHIESIDLVSLPKGVSLDEETLTTLLRVVIEFAVRGWRIPLFERIAHEPLFKTLDIPVSTIGDQIRWWEKINVAHWRQEVVEKDKYIQKQDKYIQEQLAYIEQKHNDIRERDATIRFLARPFLVRKSLGLMRRLGLRSRTS